MVSWFVHKALGLRGEKYIGQTVKGEIENKKGAWRKKTIGIYKLPL